MATPQRRREGDQDSPASKNQKSKTDFTLKDFMQDFPPLKGPIIRENESPLPSTVLSDGELQHVSNGGKAFYRSTFNLILPRQLALEDHDEEAALDVPYKWVKNQYAHCIVPELGEEYKFADESDTFETLRYIHNARVRLRDGYFLPDDVIWSLASRWILLEEKDRPPSDGYLANGEIFVATCLPLSYDDDDALEAYFEDAYTRELSASHYIPRSKYSVHFVGELHKAKDKDVQHVHPGSVLIRNTRTGDVIHIDTGALDTRKDRALRAGRVLKSWLEFQNGKWPGVNLGPISASVPLVVPGVEKETHPTLRSVHALVSASLFLRRRITNWGDVKAFTARGKTSSKTMANYALQNITGWLGLKSSRETIAKSGGKTTQTFASNYLKLGLMGRQQPAPVSKRIRLAEAGEPLVYNNEADSDDETSDRESSVAESRRESVSSGGDTVVADQPDADADDYVLPSGDEDSDHDDEALASGNEGSDDNEPAKEVSPKEVASKLSTPPDEAEDENPNVAEPHDEMLSGQPPQKKKFEKTRAASEDLFAEKLKNDRMFRGSI